MFENIYPSADNHVTGIVGLLAKFIVVGDFKMVNIITRQILY
jgi:hypothetical protein